jgi:hypothetical protein
VPLIGCALTGCASSGSSNPDWTVAGDEASPSGESWPSPLCESSQPRPCRSSAAGGCSATGSGAALRSQTESAQLMAGGAVTGSIPAASDSEYPLSNGGAVTGSSAPGPAGDTGVASNCSGAPRNSSAGSRPLPNGSGTPSSARPAWGRLLLGCAGAHCSGTADCPYSAGAR